MNKKVLLMILDGWGLSSDEKSNAIAAASTPVFDELLKEYPNSQLLTHGENVGLPEGQMGNSEVGHLNIGAGRVVYQELLRINNAIRDGVLMQNQAFNEAVYYALKHNKPLHLMGLVSDGGVHSHIDHLMGICSLLKEKEFPSDRLFIHVFTDGRDTDPQSGLAQVTQLQQLLDKTCGRIATVIGRYYAMDRDNRWERIKEAYMLLTQGVGEKFPNATEGISQSYQQGITDEFIKPMVIVDDAENPLATIAEGDAVICFNFRTDRCREITKALTQQDFPDYGMKKLSLHYTTMTVYDKTFQNVNNIFDNDNLTQTLGEVISAAGKTQVRIAETEKYPHVTFFFSGGREIQFEGEKRILVASPKVPTYDLQPEMSAPEVTNKVLETIENETPDFICLNYANTDMVGHTGVFTAAMKAAETVDACAGSVIAKALEKNYTILVTADHGNADYMVNPDGSPNTAHTTNPVPFILVDAAIQCKLRNGVLADIAPTVLHLMGLHQPQAMTGKSLITQ